MAGWSDRMTEREEFEMELRALRAFGLKDSPLRQAYEKQVAEIAEYVCELEAKGFDEAYVARAAHRRRRSLGEKYENAAPTLFREYIYHATAQKYGDPLGPGYEALAQTKTDREIIESASRPIRDLDERLTVAGFEEWFRTRRV